MGLALITRHSSATMTSLLLELLKNSNRSDRELAKVLGVSQPTVSRMKKQLVTEGTVKEFSVIPDFAKMGYRIMAISCAKFKKIITRDANEKAISWLHKQPNIIFASRAQGLGMNAVAITLHKSYAEYAKFTNEVESEFADQLEHYDTMLIDLTAPILKPFSLKYLAKHQET